MHDYLRTYLRYVTVAFFINTFPIVEKYLVQVRNFCKIFKNFQIQFKRLYFYMRNI